MHGFKNPTELKYTDESPLLFMEKLNYSRHMIRYWKYHINENIILCGLILFMRECPFVPKNGHTKGWVLCMHKPHHFGNEYRKICCGISGIMFDIKLFERKDHPG